MCGCRAGQEAAPLAPRREGPPRCEASLKVRFPREGAEHEVVPLHNARAAPVLQLHVLGNNRLLPGRARVGVASACAW